MGSRTRGSRQWNQFGARLPEDIAEWEAQWQAYCASDLYADREKDYQACGAVGGSDTHLQTNQASCWKILLSIRLTVILFCLFKEEWFHARYRFF